MVQVQVNFNTGKLTPEGKRRVALALYDRGKSFLRASAHLRKEQGYEFVALHLMCQGMEIALKAFLLFKDYNRYSNRLKRIGHNLRDLANLCSKEFGVSVGRPEVVKELENLGSLYGEHILRYGYGSILDVLADPGVIPAIRVGYRLIAAIRLANYLLGIPIAKSPANSDS